VGLYSRKRKTKGPGRGVSTETRAGCSSTAWGGIPACRLAARACRWADHSPSRVCRACLCQQRAFAWEQR